MENQNNEQSEIVEGDEYGKTFSLAELHAAELVIRQNVANEEHEAAKQEAIEQFGLTESKSKKRSAAEPAPEPAPEPEIPPAPINPFAGV